MKVLTYKMNLASDEYTKSVENAEIVKIERATLLIQHYLREGSRTLFLWNI